MELGKKQKSLGSLASCRRENQTIGKVLGDGCSFASEPLLFLHISALRLIPQILGLV
jgi:hypothetical protein